MRFPRLLGGCVFLHVALATAITRGDGGDVKGQAEALWLRAKTLLASGASPEACALLEESYRLDPAAGTLTAMAVCHEDLGKTATAWAEFNELVVKAQQTRRADREKLAREHI